MAETIVRGAMKSFEARTWRLKAERNWSEKKKEKRKERRKGEEVRVETRNWREALMSRLRWSRLGEEEEEEEEELVVVDVLVCDETN